MKKKKVLALLLSASLVVSNVPVIGFAEGTGDPVPPEEEMTYAYTVAELQAIVDAMQTDLTRAQIQEFGEMMVEVEPSVEKDSVIDAFLLIANIVNEIDGMIADIMANNNPTNYSVTVTKINVFPYVGEIKTAYTDQLDDLLAHLDAEFVATHNRVTSGNATEEDVLFVVGVGLDPALTAHFSSTLGTALNELNQFVTDFGVMTDAIEAYRVDMTDGKKVAAISALNGMLAQTIIYDEYLAEFNSIVALHDAESKITGITYTINDYRVSSKNPKIKITRMVDQIGNDLMPLYTADLNEAYTLNSRKDGKRSTLGVFVTEEGDLEFRRWDDATNKDYPLTAAEAGVYYLSLEFLDVESNKIEITVSYENSIIPTNPPSGGGSSSSGGGGGSSTPAQSNTIKLSTEDKTQINKTIVATIEKLQVSQEVKEEVAKLQESLAKAETKVEFIKIYAEIVKVISSSSEYSNAGSQFASSFYNKLARLFQ